MNRPRLPGTVELATPGYYLEPIHRAGDKSAGVVGYIEHHPHQTDPGRSCMGYIGIDPVDHRDARAIWTITAGTVEAPLTLNPSIGCRTCGHHYWIRDGAAVVEPPIAT
jgi:hypothetical protein